MNTFTSENRSNINEGGFRQEPIVISNIDDSLEFNDLFSLNKMGTSIPTPFARLVLFNGAFDHVNQVFNDATNQIPHNSDSNHHKLVSLCLDMLEFIYKYGDSSSFKVVRWDKNAQIQELKNSNEFHAKLAEAFDFAFSNDYGQYLYLFYYEGKLIGGTSPYTFVYTNPNLRETFPGLTDHNLFDIKDPKALHDRAYEFKEYLYKLRRTYQIGGTEIGKYINDSFVNYEINTPLTKVINQFSTLKENEMNREFEGSYVHLSDSNGLGFNFQPQQIPILVKDNANVKFTSGYHIRPTRDVNIAKMPLALSDAGCDGCAYIDNSYWQQGSLDPGAAATPIVNRILPKSAIKWPYVMPCDFLQDKLIVVPYNINDSKFYSGSNEKIKFLLPIKREFFKYFRPEDIPNMMTLKESCDVDGKIIDVEVQLSIPIKGGKVAFTKTYKYDSGEVIDATDGVATFDIAIFPFFKDEVVTNNNYQLMLGYNMQNVSLAYYTMNALDDELQPIQKTPNGNVGAVAQCERSNTDFKTRHYNINRAFDLLEVRIGDSVGVVLPKMTPIDSSKSSENFTFCIDFGTTNTHIAYSRGDSESDVKPFTIKYGQDEQVVYLNNHLFADGQHLLEGGFEAADSFLTKLKQEFVKPEMNEGFLPMNTVICEKKVLGGEAQLFSSMNVAFYSGDETAKLISNKEDNKYEDNLKWNTDPFSRKRMENFFVEMLMLMKHKSLLNDGGADFSVVVTHPQAMQGNVRSAFKNTWKEAAKIVGLNPNNISFEYESVAPYYSFLRQKQLTRPYVNMDIGGGSVDILYNEPGEHGTCCSYSVEFASKDIWGDGCNPLVQGGMNGFLSYYESKKGFNNAKKEYEVIKSQWKNSSSIINQLFKDPRRYNFSEQICGSRLIAIPILHFTSLIYYLGLAIKRDELQIPSYITFTGMGSKYIKMIAEENNDVSGLINTILGYCLEEKCNVEVLFADNPKQVTAEGGVTVNVATRKKLEIIKPEGSNVIGLKEEDLDSKVKVKDVLNGVYKEEVLSHYEAIVKLLGSEEFKEMLNRISTDYCDAVLFMLKLDVKQLFRDSFEAYNTTIIKTRYNNQYTDDQTWNESMFFWPLKDALYQIGVKMSQSL